jgi:hypothetical protein
MDGNVSIWAFLLGLLYLALTKFVTPPIKHNILLFCSTLIFCLLVIEGVLRSTGQESTYLEKYTAYYDFIHHGSYVDSFHIWKPYDTVYLGNGIEYRYPRIINSWGISDKEWDQKKPQDKIRIHCLGDSFTQGDGAPADSTYPLFLEQLLLKDSLNVEVMNTGVCGSDPYFELNLFKHKLAQFNPDVVIFSIYRPDFTQDIAVREGLERFDPKTGKKTKIAEVFYAYSHLFRFIFKKFGYSELLIKEDKALIDKLSTQKVTYSKLNAFMKRLFHSSKDKI